LTTTTTTIITTASTASVVSTFLLTTAPNAAWARNLPVSNGADPSNVGTIQSLVPIVRLKQSLETLQERMVQTNNANENQAHQPTTSTIAILQGLSIPTTEQDWKRLFDAYSDPVSYKQKFLDQNAFVVYYTQGYDGPGRKRMEEENVNERQTLQYSARNECWIAWENCLAEMDYFYKKSFSRTKQVVDNEEDDDNEDFAEMIKYLSTTIQAVDAYLKLAPPEDLAAAQKEL
jgi:hypothetical protein